MNDVAEIFGRKIFGESGDRNQCSEVYMKFTALAKELSGLGFELKTIRCIRLYDYLVRFVHHHNLAKIEVEVSVSPYNRGYLTFEGFSKQNGIYEIYSNKHDTNSIDNIVKLGGKMAKLPKSKATRGKHKLTGGHEFTAADRFVKDHNSWAYGTGTLSRIEIKGVVTINDKRELIDASEPGKEAWIKVHGWCHGNVNNGIDANILTNGEEWYLMLPASTKKGRILKVVNHRKRTKKIELELNEIDQDLIMHAFQCIASGDHAD